MRTALAILAAALLCGCATTKPQFEYPNGYKGLFERARKDAVARIASVDKKTPKLDTDAKGQVVPGQRKYGGTWCWYSPEWNFWVAGLCYLTDPIKPTVADNPKTGGEIHYETLVHESGHEVGWDAYGYATHPAKYARIFEAWQDPPRQSRLTSTPDGQTVVIDGYPVDADHPSPKMGASIDDAKALLRQAVQLNESAIQRTQEAIAALGETPTPDPPPPAGAINLVSFNWKLAGKDGRIADPSSIPAGARYGEGVEGGRRICQWSWPSFILHAHIIPSSRTTANGSSVTWYHFTTSGKVHPGLASYGWKNTHQTPAGDVTWYRWARTR